MHHDAHERAFWDHIMDEIMAVLQPLGPRDGWVEWSRYAAAGEWQ